jgi:hypothetical protein
MNVKLVIRNRNACLIKLGLNGFKKIEMNGPVIGALGPNANNDIDAGLAVAAHSDSGCGILKNKRVRVYYGLKKLHSGNGIVLVCDREGMLYSSRILLGVVDDSTRGKSTVGNVYNLVIGGDDLG